MVYHFQKFKLKSKIFIFNKLDQELALSLIYSRSKLNIRYFIANAWHKQKPTHLCYRLSATYF